MDQCAWRLLPTKRLMTLRATQRTLRCKEASVSHVAKLADLARELFSENEWQTLHRIATSTPLNVPALTAFDDWIPGPSVSRIADNRPHAPGTLGIPRHGITRCEVEDRDIFKPLHYCMVDFLSGEIEQIEWRTRDIIEHSGAHLEGVLKRIGHVAFLPFGDALLRRLKPEIDNVTWDQLRRFKSIHNDAKHRYDHALGTHLFSVQEAVVAYLIARRLGWKLYPLAKLKTNWHFDQEMPLGH